MNLQGILKPGKQIELNVKDEEGNAIRLKTLIESEFDGATFGMIAPTLEGTNFPLRPNDNLEIVFDVLGGEENKKKDVFRMNCMVVERKKVDTHSVVILSKTSAPKKIQRRDTYRLHILKHISYSYLGKNNDILLKNISATGLRGIVEERLPDNTELPIELDLENEGKSVTLNCKVISCAPVANSMVQHDLRLQFLKLTGKEKDLVSNFIFRKQSETMKKTAETAGRSKLYELIYGVTNNQRRGDDFIVRTVPIIGLLTWFITLAIIALVVEARPEARYNLDDYFNYYKRGYWRADLLTLAFIASFLEAIICTVGLYMNSMRMKRDDDQYNKGLIINLVFSILIMFLYVVLPIGR